MADLIFARATRTAYSVINPDRELLVDPQDFTKIFMVDDFETAEHMADEMTRAMGNLYRACDVSMSICGVAIE